MDIITVSTSRTNSEPSTGTGRRLPFSSGSPSSIFMHFMPVTKPFFSFRGLLSSLKPRISMGFERRRKSIPSSSACSTSSFRAGSSSIERRYTIYTFSAPRRNAVLAASIATFPPPTTATFPPFIIGVSESSRYAFIRLLLVRNSFAEYTPLSDSPGIPIKDGRPAPEPINTAL